MMQVQGVVSMQVIRRRFLQGLAAVSLVAVLATGPTLAAGPDDWAGIKEAAKGQTVYFHAWGGEPRINAYIDWVAGELKQQYGVTLEHVKVDDTANVVARVLAEKTAGKTSGGAVDLVWINGENFAAMKREGLLQAGAWAERLPNWALVDVEGKPTVRRDFGVPTDGLESPWGMAKLVFMHDSARLAEAPASLQALAEFAKANPGRFTYPQPPNFHGSTFLKQALATLIDDPARLQQPVDPARFDADTAKLFAWLDALHPHLWRSGRAFPASAAALRQLLADGEIDIAFSFNPGDASAAIAAGELPDTVRSFVLEGGTIGNTHFVAIPFNSSASAGAKVVANFLLSPEAQARKEDPAVWGDPTVLDVAALPDADRARFAAIDRGAAGLGPEALGPTLPEPHPSWMDALEAAWAKRYGVQ
ncbi:ABC transporter substrate-binding protein [Microvirga tunisiensis]|uniref:ABC transporter substrate-binding protein n=2 Tax=Pannonibacter tanglangensis TaxID=2750084 RepID=A0ABW9ZIL2_9HYPH|nr:ABC transporter substrate-binding protein [Pannonibacter sp. XCT-34]